MFVRIAMATAALGWIALAVGCSGSAPPSHGSTSEHSDDSLTKSDAVPPPAQEDLAKQAKAVLDRNCYVCHGKDGVAEKGLNILNWERLTATEMVVPNNVESEVLQFMLDGYMPPDPKTDPRATARPTAEEIDVVRRWILAGAPNFNDRIDRTFISPQQVFAFIESDLVENVRERDRKFARYFTLTHLYNANLRDDEIETYRLGVSNLLNSLSWAPEITVPKPIDPEHTIYRIDVRDFRWNTRYQPSSKPAWDLLVAASPYNVPYDFPSAQHCRELTQSQVPSIRGDWFVSAASRPPLYHDILEIPEKDKDLEKRLEVDVDANISQERVARAGFTKSGVSDNNRLIERHRSSYGAYWKSYDFAGNQGRQLLTSHPLGPGSAENFFKHDGGEIIFNLPNGLQAYMLIDSVGARIDKGPTSIVRDDQSRDEGKVVNGISCMRCHHQGMVRSEDEIRPFVLANPIVFQNQPETADLIKELYPPNEVLRRLFDDDARRHIEAAARAGSPMVTDEATGQPQLKDGLPMVLLARQFESELDLSLAAAEAGAESESLAAVLRLVPDLGSQLGLLLVPGKTVKRDTYVAAFPLLTSVLRPPQLVKPISLALLSADGNSVAPRQSDPIMLSQLPPGATLRLQLLSITGDEQFPRSNEVPLQSPTTVAISLSMNSKPLIDEGWQNSEIERHTRPLLVLASLGQPDATRRHTVTVDAGVDIDKWEVASGTKTKFEPVRLVPIERTATTFARHVTPTALRKLAADLDKERHRELQTNEEEIAMLRDGLQRAATNKAGDTEALDDLQKKLLQKELVDRKRVEDESRKKQYTIRGAQLMSEFIQMILGPTTSAELRYRIFADFKGHRIVLATTETDDLVVPFIHKREP